MSETHEETRLEAVVSQLPVGVAVLDLEGSVVAISREAQRILGPGQLTRGELMGKSLLCCLRSDGSRYADGEWPATRTLATGERITGERIRVEREDGTLSDLALSSSEVTQDGERVGAVVVFTDVTERERLESVQREFVTNAAHELQSPIAAIVSAIEVLQRGAKATPELDLFLGHIEREATRLTRLVRGLLALAFADLGVEATRTEIVSVADVLASAAEDLRNGHPASIVVDADPDLAVATNKLLLERIVANLAGNALKYGEGRPVHLSARRVGSSVEVAVRDEGAGIPPDDQPRVFHRFYRGQVADGSGFGLGLPIALAAAHALGGELSLDSEVGRGTTVRLTLPWGAELR